MNGSIKVDGKPKKDGPAQNGEGKQWPNNRFCYCM